MKLNYFHAAALVLAGIIGGGYFCCVSAVLSVAFLAMIVYMFLRSNTFYITCDLNLAAVVCLTAGYFLSGLWAVDSGMAFMGGIKFLPVFLFFFILCQTPDQKERLIRLLPLLGSLMTLFSFIMMQFSVFQIYVSVAGRLAGFFQYPNTYALYMLICMVISVYMIDVKKIDWMWVVHIFAALFGIYLSGSRTVMVLSLFTVFLVFLLRKELRKYAVLGLGFFIVLVLVLAFCGLGAGILSRLTSMAENASTFWGRLLYDRDAIKMIAAHPFGMGYYGYYFVQQEMQTGVYSVVNVHNEFFQIMLDIGIAPALLIYGAIIRSVISKEISERNRLILIIMTLHSLFDYDFQFLVMWFVLLLFLDFRNIRKVRIALLTKATAAAAFLAAVCALASIGVSDFFYIKGDPQKSVQYYGGNTMAKIELMKEADSMEEMEMLADSILESNRQVSVAYSAKARAAFSRGEVEELIHYKRMAIQLASYQYDEYTDYLDSLAYCTRLYLQADDRESAEFCVEEAEKIPQMLQEVGEKTSSLGWKIKDRPTASLSQKDLEKIEELRSLIDK